MPSPMELDCPADDAGHEQLGEEESAQNVCVAIMVRPFLQSELGSKNFLRVDRGQEVTSDNGSSKHQFTYDAVFGENGLDSRQLYPKCVHALVDGLFKGYNATVFAYGQTGSGKTYTMGSEYKPGKQSTVGVIPDAINSIFSRIEASPDWQCTVRVGFVEIHKEEVRDLLVTTSGPRPAVSIRESPGGGVCLYGATEIEVRSKEEMAAVLEMGTLCRATASTGMNDRSSRSHAIFTITLEQRRQISGTPGPENNGGSSARGTRTARTNGDEDDDEADDTGADGDQGIDDYLCAKMHLVDLAGSERAKRTKAEGARLKEGIHINRGLLSLGNVINAIVDNHKHIPYRDSKLTRLLQDSLGGNSRTVMIACVSPADVNYDETLNTLRYADRARHIRNKPKINRDPIAAQVAHLRQMLSQARNDNEALKRALAEEGRDLSSFGDEEGGGRWAYVQQLEKEKNALELSNTRLTIQMEDLRKELAASNDRMYSMQAELELVKASASAGGGGGGGHVSGTATPNANKSGAAEGGAAEADAAAGLPKHDVLKAHIMRIAELEKELYNFRQFQSLRRRPTKTGSRRRSSTADGGAGCDTVLHGPATPNGANSPSGLPANADLQNGVLKEDSEEGGGSDSGSEEGSRDSNADEEMFYAEMAAHAFEQEKLKQDMLALQRMLETKERKMADINKNTGQVPALRQQYDRVLVELQKERDTFMAEKAAIMQKLQQLQASSEEERRKLEAQYKEKLKNYDEKLRDVRRKEREFINMQKLKMRTEEMCSRLNADIQRIKLQKVALQKTMEGSAKQFAQWRAEREKELMQLRKQNRRNTAQIQSLEAMQAKQNAVLQRKIADAAAARKKLKELQAASKEGSHGLSTAASMNGSLSASMSGRPGTASSNNNNSNGELQPNAQAPLLRNEKARREWVEMELDNCNLSYEYRRVLDGELAQRAEANRLLKEVEKRLMIAKDLVPASPLIPSGSCRPPLPPANLEGRARLVERKAQLEAQVCEHNQQILELQGAFEKAKQEEENRGGGAADAKRWTGVRNAPEARELLRTVFRIACDHKTLSNEAAIERAKLLEEIELMKVQLDAARKEVEAQHKRCAAIEASAANVMASPYNGGTSHASHYRTDEMDTECDDLLQQLQVVAQSPARPLPDVAAGDEVALASPDTSVQNSVELKPSGSRPLAPPKGSRLDLSQAASQLMRCSMAPQSGVQGPGSGRYAGMSAYDQDTIKGAPEEEEEEYMETDTAEEMDDLDADDTEWDPAHPTPPRGNSRKNTLNSNSSSGRHTGGSSSGRRRVPARPTILDPNTFSIPAMVAAASNKLPGQGSDPQPQAPRGSQRQDAPARPTTDPSQGPLSHRVSISDIGSVASSVATLPQNEGLVLEDVNSKRAAAGEDPVNRLTVKLLKDALAGSVGPDGKQWRPGNKTREQLLRDYHIMLGQTSDATSSGPPSSSRHASSSQQPQADSVPSSALPPPSVLSPPQPFMDTNDAPTQSAPRHQPSDSFVLQPPTHRMSRNDTLSIGTLAPAPEPASPRPNWLQRVPTSAASPSPSFKSRNGEDDFGFGNRILEESSTPSPVSGLTFNPNPHANNGPAGATEEGLQGEHAMTPLSKLYIQKAQEARDRTAALRQSISRQSLSSLRPSLNAQRHSQTAQPTGSGPNSQHIPHTTTTTTTTTSTEHPTHAPPSSLPQPPATPSQPTSYASALSAQPPPPVRSPPPPASASAGARSAGGGAQAGSPSSSPTAAQASSSPTSAAAAAHRSPRMGSILSNLQASQQNSIPNRSSPATRVAVHSATGGNPGSPSARTASYASAAARVSGHGHPQGAPPQRSNSGRSPSANLSASKTGWKPSSFALSGGGSGSSSSSPKCGASPKAVNTPRSRNSKGGSPAGAWR